MNKISRLETIHAHLRLRQHSFVTRLLHAERHDIAPQDCESYLMAVGQSAFLQAEVEDHCDSLRHIAAACEHGLAGTTPDGYDEDGYEVGEDPETPELPYDPYTDILGYLHGGGNISCRALTGALRCFIELLPEVTAEQAERTATAGRLLRPDEQGTLRPMTQRELRSLGNRAVVEAVEGTLFAASYADDMQRIQALAEQRGDLRQILDLLQV